MKCKFCGAEVHIGNKCEYCGSVAELSYYPDAKCEKLTEKHEKKACPDAIVATGICFDEIPVARGDNLWKITKKYYGETSIKFCKIIADFNGIEDMNIIYPGDIIRLPRKKSIIYKNT